MGPLKLPALEPTAARRRARRPGELEAAAAQRPARSSPRTTSATGTTMELVEAHHPYFLVAASYALLGIALSALYYFSSKARDEPVVHLLTFPLICLSTGLAVVSTSVELQTSGYYQRGMWGYAL